MTDYINTYFNEDCITGCRQHLPDDCVDLIVTDPPYGIEGDRLDKHYNRNEAHVVEGYIEIPQPEYPEFTRRWVSQAERILRPGGSVYIISGYTNLPHVLNALHNTSLEEINHIIWKYNFGVYTKRKYVSSHYHILYYAKPGGNRTFNTYVRYGAGEKNNAGRSENYADREDVWVIPREYKPGEAKNKNELPEALLTKIIRYSSNEGDLVCDLFLGSFSTARVARGLNRNATGFEKSTPIYQHHLPEVHTVEPGSLLGDVRTPSTSPPPNQGDPWSEKEKIDFKNRYRELREKISTKKEIIRILSDEFGRGYFSILNKINQLT